MKKTVLLLVGLFTFFCAFAQQQEQENFVKDQPPLPKIIRVEAPSTKHVWIEEDWKYNITTSQYEWTGGRWAEPPQPEKKWRKGKWKKAMKGYTWIPGAWE